MSTATRYKHLRAEIDKECKQLGRNPEEVLLLAVSKTVDVDQVQVAIDAGATAFGENRPDELLRKHAAFPQVAWHFIGNIQSRRIHDIVSCATLIHSVSKEEHLPKINHAAQALDKVQHVLLEVNVSGEESKSGFKPEEVEGVLDRAQALSHVAIDGLMTMAPQGDAKAIDFTFSGLQKLEMSLNDHLKVQGNSHQLSILSMGMTEDWPVAVKYGSTIVRLGRAVFSESFE
ncbi:MAG: YggS family pyridoxal phosphate-dependent enzyme [Eggerthellaceae bacterium]